MPATLTTDRGTQFTSGTWVSWCREQRVNHITTTAYRPQANGMVERLHRQLKEALRARGAASTWIDHLPWVLLGIRTAPKDESGVLAAEATLGQQLVVPGQLQQPGLLEAAPRAPPAVIPASRRTYAEVVATPSQVDQARMVYIRKGGSTTPLADSYEGPFHVLARDKKTVTVQIGERQDIVSRDRVKPHLGESDPVPAKMRGRGQPPGTGGSFDTF